MTLLTARAQPADPDDLAGRPTTNFVGSPMRTLRRQDLHSSLADPILDTMNFLNEITSRYPKAISFAPGRPYDGHFETAKIFTYIGRYIEELAQSGSTTDEIREALFQYGPTGGRIRELIAKSLREDERIDVEPESIVVTVGCQEAMFLAVRALITGPDDVLLVSNPCYVGIAGAARLLDVTVAPVDEHEDGLRCADVGAAIEAVRSRGQHPRALYVVPDHSNPSGTTMSARTRRELLDLAAKRDILILEDSPYRLVSPGSPEPALKALDRQRRVIHLGSFSKTAFPGARVGYVIADQNVVDPAGKTCLLADELAKIKSMVTVNTPSLSQAAIAGMLLECGGRISRQSRQVAAHYGEAMQCALGQLGERFPSGARAALGVHWNEPHGGFFLTLRVPFHAGDEALTRSAEEYGVIWTPMSYFYLHGGGYRSIRLSVSCLTPAEIKEGIARLANFIEDEAERHEPITDSRFAGEEQA